MPIEFACSECHRGYRVKDELAGKTAKCGKCGHRMRIPQTTHSQAAAATPSSTKAPVVAGTPKVAAGAPKAPAKPSSQSSMSSWLDEELEASQPSVPTAPKTPKVSGATCPACGATLAAGAVLCVACGYDTRTRSKHQTQHLEPAESPAKKAKRRSKAGSAASLLRGTVFSFIGAMLGAVIWALFTYFTMWEHSFIALGLGGLAGFGMALGHDDDDGTVAGIIAAFMSLVGIVAAKILIIVIFIAAFVGEAAQEADPAQMKRMLLTPAVASEKLKAKGIDLEEASDEQWEQAEQEAEAELAKLSDEDLDARFEALSGEPDEDAADGDQQVADAEVAGDDAGAVPNVNLADELAEDDEPGAIGMFFKLMFSPIDGIFILLAFFTAYKVGSGQVTD
ncbi:MAG TPA: hypothetical protein VHK01_01065 [Lacipirellulaceae bacterium]|jgi:hypothetical protein|nr:hypothetical protein [Lacipirellulaceae bacterium]